MIKQTFVVLTIITGLALVYSPSTYAVVADGDSAVSTTFKQIGRALRGVRQAKTPEDLLELLTKVRALAVENKENVPSFMTAGSPELEEFLTGMDTFIERIDAAISAAEAGDMEGAMKGMGNIRDSKDEFHEQFEIEDSE